MGMLSVARAGCAELHRLAPTQALRGTKEHERIETCSCRSSGRVACLETGGEGRSESVHLLCKKPTVDTAKQAEILAAVKARTSERVR